MRSLRDPALLLPALAHALELKEQPGIPLAETLSATLTGKRALLLLDNAEHLLPAVALDAARLRDLDGPTVLVTTRERLQLQGEHVWAVPSLDDDGRRRPCSRRERVRSTPAFDRPPRWRSSARSSTTCRSRSSSQPRVRVVFSPEQLLERLQQRLDLLKGGRDADPRQQTLRATIEWSHELLTTDEQRLFRELSVFVGGCTYEAAERVCAADPDTMQSLLDKSLLRRRDTAVGPRYWMLETINEYASERLAAVGGRDALRARHLGHFLAFVEQQEPRLRGAEEGSAFALVRQELPNIRRALECALANRDAEAALRMTGSLHAFWYHSGFFSEGRRWAEEALRLGGEPANREKALATAGELALLQGELDLARLRLDERLELCQRLGGNDRLASTYTLSGHLAAVEGEWERARGLYEQSLEFAERRGPGTIVWQGRAVSLSNIGWALLHLGELDAAEARLREGLEAADEAGSAFERVPILNNLGRVALARGDLGALRLMLEDGARAAASAPDPHFLNEWFELAARLLSGERRDAGCARAVGAAQRLRELVGVPADLEDVPNLELVDEARARMTAAAWAEELAIGRLRAVDDPVGLAVDCLD